MLSKELFNRKSVILVMKKVNLDIKKYSVNKFYKALNVELEHGYKYDCCNVTSDKLLPTAKIVVAHLKETPDYYERLYKLEQSADKHWKIYIKPNIWCL